MADKTWTLEKPNNMGHVVITREEITEAVTLRAGMILDALTKKTTLIGHLVLVDSRLDVWLTPMTHFYANVSINQGDNITSVVEKFIAFLEGRVHAGGWFIVKHKDYGRLMLLHDLKFQRERKPGYGNMPFSENIFTIRGMYGSAAKFNKTHRVSRLRTVTPETAVELARIKETITGLEAQVAKLRKEESDILKNAYSTGAEVTNKELYKMLEDEEACASQ